MIWVHKNLKTENSKEIKDKVFRRRTTQQILKDGFVTGCTDFALVFISFCRAKKIPTKYVETIRRKWLDIGDENLIEGHVFAECFINDKWYIIDPDQATIKAWYDRWVIYKKGLDSWDIGINNYDELKEQFLEFKDKFNKK